MSHVLQLGGNIVLAMVLLLLIAVLISVYSMSTNIRRSLQESGIRNIDTLCEIRFLDELDSELQSDPRYGEMIMVQYQKITYLEQHNETCRYNHTICCIMCCIQMNERG